MKNKALIEREDYVSEIDGKTYYFCKITLPKKIWEDDYRWIEFESPLVFTCHFIQEATEEDPHQIAFFTFDFGMDGQTNLNLKHNCILMGKEDASNEEKMVIDVIFDLFHAFFHYNGDPNYNYYHWALYGNLKDRVKIGELDE